MDLPVPFAPTRPTRSLRRDQPVRVLEQQLVAEALGSRELTDDDSFIVSRGRHIAEGLGGKQTRPTPLSAYCETRRRRSAAECSCYLTEFSL